MHMPDRARHNAHEASARDHARAWARDMGLLDGRVWDARRFDAIDRATLCAHTHPDAPAPALEVITGWYVWIACCGEFRLRLPRAGDARVARRPLARLPALTPIDGPDVVGPAPSHPIERALADLWSRTAPHMSRDWRIRFAEHTRDLLRDPAPELAGVRLGRVPDPFEHVVLRRRSGGALWSADLVEYAGRCELPGRLAGSRPLRVLTDCFADAAHLRGDLFSLRRASGNGGQVDNAVLVVQRFLRCDLRVAAGIVDGMLTSRLRLFEHTAGTELPELLDDHGAGPDERERVLAYIAGLRDWQAGCHAWHLRSGRQLDGAADAQPRTVGVRPTAGPARLPDFSSTVPARLNPYVHGARIHAERWARAMGMLDAAAVATLDGTWQAGTWDERAFRAADLGQFAALTHPDAQPAQLDLVADWHVWMRFLRDAFARASELPPDLPGARRFLSRLPLFMPDPPLGGAGVPPENAVERGLADLWSRTAPGIPMVVRGRFRAAVRSFTDSFLWELRHVAGNRVPDAIDFLEMRRRTAGAELSFRLAWLALNARFPAELFASAQLRTLAGAFADIWPWRADVLSYRERAERGIAVTNGVAVMRRLLGCDAQDAVDVIGQLVDLRLRRFERIATDEVPLLFPEFAPDAAARERLRAHVACLRDWLAGDLAWALRAGRSPGSAPPPAATEPPGTGPDTWARRRA